MGKGIARREDRRPRAAGPVPLRPPTELVQTATTEPRTMSEGEIRAEIEVCRQKDEQLAPLLAHWEQITGAFTSAQGDLHARERELGWELERRAKRERDLRDAQWAARRDGAATATLLDLVTGKLSLPAELPLVDLSFFTATGRAARLDETEMAEHRADEDRERTHYRQWGVTVTTVGQLRTLWKKDHGFVIAEERYESTTSRKRVRVRSLLPKEDGLDHGESRRMVYRLTDVQLALPQAAAAVVGHLQGHCYHRRQDESD